ncbi:ATP-dependent DNA helicase [Phocaeicola vulgatus]|nr:ATP-dependent RecD-like DNA helicase [Phocaeicola vulgatus]
MKALDLKNINRIILIGDPFQLPPIGPGRPFADLFNYLKDNKDEYLRSAITKLRYVVRTINTEDSDILTLASWFSGEKPAKNSDLIFEQVAKGNLNNDLAVYTWNDENDLKDCLKEAIEKELPEEEGKSLSDKIRKSIGLDDVNKALNDPSKVERFQVLSPVRNPVWGTFQINSYFQEWVGINKNFSIEIAPITISALDKVIQLKNERKKSTSKEECQLSNGQIGFVNYANKREKKSTVVFTGLPNKRFSYYSSKSDEADNTIDLAYAITIHKSQGSDFDTVLVVLPKSGRILSRELIYTALTRARKKLILLIQDNISWLIEYTKPQMSVLAKRNTNLFSTSVREDISNIPYVEGLIHTTLKPGLIVRSKSEVIIANMLYERGIDFEYERMIEDNGRRCIPDFTFEDASGDTILWEHLGMLDNPAYKESWEKKRDFYKSIGYIEGVNLFTTVDHENGSIDSTEIAAIVDKLEDLI